MATTVSVQRNRRESSIGTGLLAAAVKVLAGTIVNYDSAKNVKGGSDTSGEVFAGISIAEVDNTAGAAGAKEVELWKNGVFRFKLHNGAVLGDIGTQVFVYDNDTVAKTGDVTNQVSVGYISDYIDATYVEVTISVFGA